MSGTAWYVRGMTAFAGHSRCATGGPRSLASGRIGNGIGLHPGEQVIVVSKQAIDDFASGVVRIGHEVEQLPDI